MVFLIEIKCGSSKMEKIKRILAYDYCFTVDSIGLRGGLALLWNQNLDLSITSYSLWHINAHISLSIPQRSCLITSFYEHPETTKRSGSWSLLNCLNP